MRSLFRSVGVVLAVAVLVCGGTSLFKKAKTRSELIVIGAILPLSGANAASGAASLAGIRLAVEDLKKTHRGGDVSIVILDSASDPERGKAAAEILIQNNDAEALFSSFTYITQEVSPIAKQFGIPLLYDSCNCGFAEENPSAFQMYFDPRKECRAAAVRHKGLGKVAYVGLDVPYGRYCYESMIDELGADQVVIEKEAPGTLRDYGALIASLRNRGVGSIVAVPSLNDFPGLIAADKALETPFPIVCFRDACLPNIEMKEKETGAQGGVEAFSIAIHSDFSERAKPLLKDSYLTSVTQSAVAHDAIMTAAEGLATCAVKDAECAVKVFEKVRISSKALDAKGFGSDHVLRYETEISHF